MSKEFIERLHKLEDKYARTDYYGNVKASILNVPDDDPELQQIQKELGYSKHSYERHNRWSAYDKDGNTIASDDNKTRLILCLNKLGYKSVRVSDAIKIKSTAWFDWGMIVKEKK